MLQKMYPRPRGLPAAPSQTVKVTPFRCRAELGNNFPPPDMAIWSFWTQEFPPYARP